MFEILTAKVHPQLKRLVGIAADEREVSMNEWVATVLAKAVRRPDLAGVPRKRPGRPRKEIAAS